MAWLQGRLSNMNKIYNMQIVLHKFRTNGENEQVEKTDSTTPKLTLCGSLGVTPITKSHSAVIISVSRLTYVCPALHHPPRIVPSAVWGLHTGNQWYYTIGGRSGKFPKSVFMHKIIIQQKYDFVLIKTVIKWSQQNFAHAMTAQMSWHVQNVVAIWMLGNLYSDFSHHIWIVWEI